MWGLLRALLPGEGCTEDGLCNGDCVPQCEGKICGDDGCSASCGTCPTGHLCDPSGACEDVPGCGGLTHEGICHGSVVSWCENEQLQTYDCAAVGKACAWVEGAGYTCVETATHCVSSCKDKECGPDGCGGWCGICGTGEACIDNTCLVPGGPSPDPNADGSSSGDGVSLEADVSSADAKGRDAAGCATTGPGPFPWLALLALLAFARRRRSRVRL